MKKKQKQQPVSSKKRPQRPAANGKRKYFILLFIIVLISLIAYLPVLQNGFVNLDDDKYIQNNPMLLSIDLKQIFSRFVEGNYHPLTMLTYSIEYRLFGLNAQGYHAVNLLIHLFNVFLVFYAVLYLSDKKEVALVASLLFGIHPLHVESVAWASELKDLLYTFFFLAGWICYLRFIKGEGKKFYIYCLLLFLLSLLSKAMAVSLPVVLLLTDYFKGRKLNVKVWIEKIPFFALSILFGMVAISAQKSMGAIQDMDAFPLFQRMVFACYSFITYLFKLFIPVHLSAFYPYPIRDGESIPAGFYIYVVLFFILVAAIVYSVRFSRKMLFGMAFFAITIFLVLQLLPVGGAIMADRYSYIPSIGIFFLAGEGFYRLWTRRKQTSNFKLPATILLGAIVIIFSVQTYTRCAVWENGMTLWNDVINKEPTVALAYNNRAALWIDDKKYKEALDDYNKAIEIRPAYAEAYQNRGVLLAGENRYAEALKDYNKAIELKPGFTEAYNNRGMLQMGNQKYDEALKDYQKAIELQPDYAIAYNNRGNLFLTIQKIEQALQDYNKATELKPDDPKPYNGRGVLLMRQQKYDQAVGEYNKAIEAQPDYAEAFCNRAIAQYNSGRKNAACLDLKQALSLRYQPAEALYNQWCQ